MLVVSVSLKKKRKDIQIGRLIEMGGDVQLGRYVPVLRPLTMLPLDWRELPEPFFFFQAEDGIRDYKVTGVQTCALPIYRRGGRSSRPGREEARGRSAD